MCSEKQTSMKTLKEEKIGQEQLPPMLALSSGPLQSSTQLSDSASTPSLPWEQFLILDPAFLSPALGPKTLTSGVIEPLRTTKEDLLSPSFSVFQGASSLLCSNFLPHFLFSGVTTKFEEAEKSFSSDLFSTIDNKPILEIA